MYKNVLLEKEKISIDDKIEIIKSLERGLKKALFVKKRFNIFNCMYNYNMEKKVAILNAFKNCGHNEATEKI